MGRQQKYPVRLTDEEREQLRTISADRQTVRPGDAASTNPVVER